MPRRCRALTACALVLSVAACVDSSLPTDVRTPAALNLAASPQFSSAPSADVVARLEAARITVLHAATDSVLTQTEVSLAPDAQEWVLEVSVDVQRDALTDLRLDVELLHRDEAEGEVVEFAGRAAFAVTGGGLPADVRIVSLGRGPLANLDLESLNVSVEGSSLLQGGTTRLTVDGLGVRPGQAFFFRSMNGSVVAVDPTGSVSGLAPGTAQVVVEAGRVADTVHVAVRDVAVPRADVVQVKIGPQVDYVVDHAFISTFSDGAAAQELQSAVVLLMEDMLAGRGPQAVGRFETAVARWTSYGEGTDLRLLEAPQLALLELTLMHAADALGIAFR